jgi:SAM-dependent methyltransferase
LETVIRELARFLDVSYDEALKRVKEYNLLSAAEKWEKKHPVSAGEVEEFYRTEDFYLYELIPWNYGNNPVYTARVAPLLHYRNRDILELGAGIGSLCIALAYADNRPVYCDISERLTAFARQRFQDRQLNIPIVKDMSGIADVDIVVANDFFEHIHKDALPKMLKEIASVLKDGGFLYARSNFKQQELYPMHFDHSEYFNKMASDAGLKLRTNGDYEKGGHSNGVQIGVPIAGPVEDELFFSLIGLIKPPETIITKVRDMAVDVARNKIVSRLEKDWIFFMDSDQTFPPETLTRLLSWDLPVVSGLYFKTPGLPVPHCYKYAWEKGGKTEEFNEHSYMALIGTIQEYLSKFGDKIKKGEPTALIPASRADLIECDGIGGGCLLVHKRVFEAIEPPYFKCSPNSNLGEDFYFCRKVQEAGFKIFVDPGIICGHRAKGLIGYRHFLNWIANAPRKDIEWAYPWE